MTRPTVLHVLVPEPPGHVGGADLHVLDLAAEQLHRGPVAPLVLEIGNLEFAARLAEARVPYVSGTAASPLGRLRLLDRLGRDGGVAVVHAHGYDADYVATVLRWVWRLRRRPRVPLVVTAHGFIEDTWWHRAKTALDLRCIRRADAVVVCGPTEVDRLRRVAPDALVRHVANGIDTAWMHGPAAPPFRTAHAIPEGAPVVTMLGRLSPEKGGELFLDVAADVLAREPDARFVLVGSGSDRAALEGRARRLGIEDRVLFTGLVPRPAVAAVLAATDVLLVTSVSEGTPRAVLEALAHGVPVVGAAVGGVPELVRHDVDGLLGPRDRGALAALTLEALARRGLGGEGPARVAAQFSAAAMADAVEEVYRAVLGARAGEASGAACP